MFNLHPRPHVDHRPHRADGGGRRRDRHRHRAVARGQLGGEPAQAAELADRVSRGDLSSEVHLYAGDATSLMANLARMQHSLGDVVAGVRQSSGSVTTASAQIAQGNQDLSQRTEEQASALQQTAATMEQVGATVRSNADNARLANQMAVASPS